MRKTLITSASALLLLTAGCSQEENAEESQPEANGHEQSNGEQTDNQHDTTEVESEPEVIAENLSIPWSIEKVNEAFYVTEREGSIVKIENGEAERQEVALEEELATASEAGLLGLVLTEDFSESNLAYAYYTYTNNEGQFNRIVTLSLEDNTWTEESVLLDEIPSGSVHHGGRLKLGPDGYLYATAGDASEPDLSQDIESLGGNILRLNTDGSVPDDNPFENSYVFSYGHRNPQGLAWSTDGTFYSSEHGNSANDEINEIEDGSNYGWPVIEGNEEQEDMIAPIFTSGEDSTWAPSGMDYYEDKLYVAALRGTAVLEFDLETNEYSEFVTELGRVRDVMIEDGMLYFISNNTDGRGDPGENDDKLYKVSLTE
ncbi:PQQ-dependent sugar dehydrogenase [Jeotgalibacillus proteolyticus]|uniref:Quinoprotein glucose dehydrogenase n=1 Tax=Jeotgalibacillus proteolyticus TaxID=2082395 RepID=A0A2S5GH44_9BACL|nr:sorbosone dehydrogenase family protein [Jeotgalibacillus proteolyticus]PPA72296.1 quinoprotein glucose dehydrogenase [Jeotgalibacillus proteolyticus]